MTKTQRVKATGSKKKPNGGLKAIGNMPTPRRLAKIALCVSLWSLFSLMLYAATVEPYNLQVSYPRIGLTGGEPVKLRLALISDLHGESASSQAVLARAVEEINRIGPDYTIIAGDLVDDKAEYITFLSPLLGLDRNRTIITLGNHDYGPGWSDGGVADAVESWADGNGFTLLRNGNLRFSRSGKDFCIIGADSLWAKKVDLERAFSGVDDDCTKILIVHEPDSILELGNLRADLILAGHTHGGQVCLPLLGSIRNERVVDDGCIAGWYDIGGMPLYVTRGVGQSLWLRFNARPEITVIEIS